MEAQPDMLDGGFRAPLDWPRSLALWVAALSTFGGGGCSVLVAKTQTELESQNPTVLRVGIKEAVPFSMKQDDGTWSGISVELWRELAAELSYDYEYTELTLEQLIDALDAGEIDVAFGALTITYDRERRIDFTHSYYNTGLGIAVSLRQYQGWSAVVRRLVSTLFLQVIAGILAVLVVTGILVYLFERKANPEQFGRSPLGGIANGIWWAAVTMTTVGYGDRVPKSFGGRLMAVVWMFSALIIIASFTASVTSTLTLARLESAVQSPRDLNDVRVASVTGSTSADYLEREGIAFRRFETLEDCLEALQAGQFDAVVYDAPILRYLCLTQFPGELEVLPASFEKQDYAFALQTNSVLREPMNQALLIVLGEPGWQEILQRHLGQSQ